MPTVMISHKGELQSKYPLVQNQTRIGRRSDNEIVLGSLSVSGAHAVLIYEHSKLVIQDLGSRNGTFVDGLRVDRMELQEASVVRIGEFSLTVIAHEARMAYEPTLLDRVASPGKAAQFRHLDASAWAQTTALTHVLTMLGVPGVCQVTCIRRGDEYAVRFEGGPVEARLNGALLGATPVRLYDGDVLQLAAEQLRFESQAR